MEEAVAEEFGHGTGVGGRHAVEAAFLVEEAIGGEDMNVGVEEEVVAKGMDGGGGGDASVGEMEAEAEGVAEGVGGSLEEQIEEMAAFAEDAAEHFGDRKHELAVGDGVADGGGGPCAGVEGAALVAGGAEVAGFAGEGEEVLVAATGAEESGEAGGEVAAADEVLDVGDGIGTQGAHGGTVILFVAGEEIVPAMVNQLPER
jgi:hypothetical protein